MKKFLRTDLLVVSVLIGGATVAAAQGGSTDAYGNANGSEHVGSAGGYDPGSGYSAPRGTV